MRNPAKTGPFPTVNVTVLINTPLQRGDGRIVNTGNRFNGFPRRGKTVETVSDSPSRSFTPLKRGVNERRVVGPGDFVNYAC